LPFFPHCSLFITSISPENHLVVTSRTCIPSPGRLSCECGMNVMIGKSNASSTVSTASRSSTFEMSMTQTPASGRPDSAFDVAQVGSAHLATYATSPSGSTATSATRSGLVSRLVTCVVPSRFSGFTPNAPGPGRKPSCVWPFAAVGTSAAATKVNAASTKTAHRLRIISPLVLARRKPRGGPFGPLFSIPPCSYTRDVEVWPY
jgi:hypothetical protein